MNDGLKSFSSTVRVYTEDDVKVIGYGDDDESPDRFMIITRYNDPGAPWLPREEMIGIQTSESDHEVCAAISSIKLSRGSIEIEIREDKAGNVGGRLGARFNISDDEYEELRRYVDLVCAGSRVSLISQSTD